MAKITKNGLSGVLGNVVFRQMPDGTTLVTARPDFSRRKFSQGQKDHQQRFRDASSYARSAAKAEPLYAELATRTKRTAYNIALSDWFNPPVIHQIRREDGRILVEASDNVMVARVWITVLDDEGNLLEAGEGTRQKDNWWEFVPTSEGPGITAEAWDLAGNVTKSVL